MIKHFFDYKNGDFVTSISNNMAIDSDGNFMMRIVDNTVMDIDTGDIHFISGWFNDEGD